MAVYRFQLPSEAPPAPTAFHAGGPRELNSIPRRISSGFRKSGLGLLAFLLSGIPAQAATSIFEFTNGSLDATHLGRSGFTTSAVSQQYDSSVSYNQNGQTLGNFEVAAVTPAAGSSAEAEDAVGWLLASTFKGGAGSFPSGGVANTGSTGYRFTVSPESGYTLDFSGARFVLDLGASKRSTASASGTLRMGVFYRINNGPITPLTNGRDFDVTVDNNAPNISALDSVDNGDSLLDPGNAGSLARTIDNNYRMLTGLSADLGESITGLSQGDNVTFYLLGITNRNGTAYNMLVDNLGIAGLTASNPSVTTEQLAWKPGLDNKWGSTFEASGTITRPDGTVEHITWVYTNWGDGISGQLPDADTNVRFVNRGGDKTVLLQRNRPVAGAEFNSQFRYSLDQLSNRYARTLFLDGDLSVANPNDPTVANFHRAYCNIEIVRDSTWEIGPNQVFDLYGELRGFSTLTKSGQGELWLYSENSTSFLGDVNLQEGELIASTERLANSVVSFTEAPDANASRTLFLGGFNPNLRGISGPADGVIFLTEPGESLSLGSEGILNDGGYSTTILTIPIGPAPALDLGGSTYHCNISESENDLLVLPGDFDISGATLQIHAENLVPGSNFVIATYGGSLIGSFANVSPANYTVTASNGQLIVTAPDPDPVITLVGESVINLLIGNSYVEPGVIIEDNDPGLVPVIGGDFVDTTRASTYTVTYDVTDSAGNAAVQQSRTVIVTDPPPVITLIGDSEIFLQVGDTYLEQGAIITDNDSIIGLAFGGDIVDTSTPGIYRVTYDATDSAGNSAIQQVRTVHVIHPNLYVDALADYTITIDQGAAGLDDGDEVTWNGLTTTVPGLIFGYNAFDSIQDAVDVAGDGTIVDIAAGTYLEGATIEIDAKSIILRGEGANQTVIDGNNTHQGIYFDVRTLDRGRSAEDDHLQILDLSITNCNSTTIGGGIVTGPSWAAKITMLRSAVTNCTTTSEGGGLYVYTELVMKNCLIANNSAAFGAALKMWRIDDSSFSGINLLTENCTFSGNTSTGNQFQVENCHFSNLCINSGTLIFRNCTFAGPAYFDTLLNGSDGRYQFSNCLFAGGSSRLGNTGDRELLADSKTANLGGNYINRDLVGGSWQSIVPDADLIDPVLRDNGGPTFTHALPDGSPALDGGQSSGLLATDVDDLDQDGNTTEFLPVDQRGAGFDRISGDEIDIGAFEYQITPMDIYEDWILQYYPGETDPAIIGPNADPSGNGVTNWFSFISDLDPTSDTGQVLDVTYNPTSISISYTIRDDVGELSPGIQLSANLSEFDDIPTFLSKNNINAGFGGAILPFLRTTVDGANVNRLTITIPTGDLPTVFHRFSAKQ